jgi:L-ascorbate metabolism protein UlaG (beta-lactamase superfamily)
MEITWYGLSCFKLAERGMATVVTDPYDHRQAGYDPLKLKADIVTISHNSPGHNYLAGVQGTPYVINGPGEYEVGGVFITGIQIEGHHQPEDGRNTLYVFDFNSITVAHLGDLTRMPTQAEVEALGIVNVALIPIGINDFLNPARAAEVINLLEPNIVIPMHFAAPDSNIPLDSLSKFLKEMGISAIETLPSLKVSSTSLPEETQVTVLDYQSS